jgi:hypothetical protein
VTILHDPLEQVNGQKRAFGAYSEEGGTRGCHMIRVLSQDLLEQIRVIAFPVHV